MKYFYKMAVLLVTAFLLPFTFDSVFAESYIDETNSIISTNTIWTKDISPYIVYQDMLVEKGAILTIEAGTIIKFESGRYLNILGEVIVQGTESEKVYFTSLYDDFIGGDTDGDEGLYEPYYSDWGGIYIFDEGTLDMSNSEILYASDALMFDYSSGILNSVRISDCRNVLGMYESSLSLNRSTIENIYPDMYRYAFSIYSNNILDINNSIIKNIDGNIIDGGENTKISIYDSSIEDILNGSIADVWNSSSLNIENSNIKNIYEGVSVYNNSNFIFKNSVIDSVLNGGWSVFPVYNNSSLNISSSTIRNIFADSIVQIFNGVNANISDSLIENIFAGDVFVVFGGNEEFATTTFNISDSTLRGGDGNAFQIFTKVDVNISNIKIKDFSGIGIETFSYPEIEVIGSEISGNDIGIASYGSNLLIKNSSIFGNTTFGIFNISAESAPSIKAINNWWGDVSGPFNELLNATGTANTVTENVEFSPWLISDPSGEKCCSNVLFIPGLQASRLYKKGLLLENQLWEPNRNTDVEKLYLDSNGNSLDSNIYTNDIIKKTNIGMGVFDENIYQKFSDTMDSLVSLKKINGWEALPYDWRFDLNKIVEDGVKMADGSTLYFINELIKNANTSATGKVTIVTHSNGGLIAKVLINELKARGKENLVDKLIMIASPQLGTPEAIVGVLHGDERQLVNGLLLDKTTARTLGENMMGAYNLFPEDKYFSDIPGAVIKFDASIDKVNFPTKQAGSFRVKYGNVIDSASKLRDFLLGKDGRVEPENNDTNTPNVLKTSLLNLAQSNHTNLDSWVPPENIKVSQLAGWGVKTISGIEYFGKETCATGFSSCVPVVTLDRRPIYTDYGDKTVVMQSAVAMEGVEKYYLNMKTFKQNTGINLEHKNILEATSSIQFITNFVLNENTDISEYISTTTPLSTDKTLEIGLHSPVSINIYDKDGNHTGLVNNPNSNSDLEMIEENIPGSRYIDFGEGKYVLLDADTEYSIKLQGLDFGTFTLETKNIERKAVISTSSFVNIPTSPSMIGEIILGTTTISNPIIKIDSNGDGKTDFTVSGGQDIDPIVYLQILRKTVETFDVSKKTKDEVIKKIDSIIKLLQKNKTKTAILKIKSFSKELTIKVKDRQDKEEKKHKNEKDWKNKKHQLTKENSESLLAILNQLLDNLIK